MLEFDSLEDAHEAEGRLVGSGVLDRFDDSHGPNVVLRPADQRRPVTQPGAGGERERLAAGLELLPQLVLECGAPLLVERDRVGAGRADAHLERAPQILEVVVLHFDDGRRVATSSRPASATAPRARPASRSACARPRPARRARSRAPRPRTRAASSSRPSSPTRAADTVAPTRAISRTPASASVMKFTTSWQSAWSNSPSANGSDSAAATSTRTPGSRARGRGGERLRRVGGGDAVWRRAPPPARWSARPARTRRRPRSPRRRRPRTRSARGRARASTGRRTGRTPQRGCRTSRIRTAGRPAGRR